ncbi:hypothetical protein CK203_097840 [Vitis vinifera]|uniref:Uncharacterized protein n=1 Tax=Vitis vinifera TaxID=29760 RepID=A0A438DFZ1_VITVI|nr:hypothetical protein CK203_097840 [Vitis vinifera]
MGEVAGFGERAAEFLAEKKNRGEGLQLAGSQSTSLKGNCSGLVLSEGQRFSEGRQSLNGKNNFKFIVAGFGERAAEFLAEKKNRGEGLQLAGSQSTSLKGNCSGMTISLIFGFCFDAHSSLRPATSPSFPFLSLPSFFLFPSFLFHITTATTASDPRLLPPFTCGYWCRQSLPVRGDSSSGLLEVVAVVI